MFTGTYPMLNGMHDFAATSWAQHSPLWRQSSGKWIRDRRRDRWRYWIRAWIEPGFDFYYDTLISTACKRIDLEEMERPAPGGGCDARLAKQELQQENFSCGCTCTIRTIRIVRLRLMPPNIKIDLRRRDRLCR